MKRWNGWGDDQNDLGLELSASALGYLQQLIGPSTALPDATLEQALAGVPPSRLPPHRLVSLDTRNHADHNRRAQEAASFGCQPRRRQRLGRLILADPRQFAAEPSPRLAFKDDEPPRHQLFVIGNPGGKLQQLPQIIGIRSRFA